MTASLDLAGIGVGPFNLSIAALLASKHTGLEARFFDAKAGFDWHPGMLLPGVRLQTSYLKDLVTGVAPTSPYSFLNYLVSQKRFYQFLSAELPAISRFEYGQYLAWAASRLDSLHFDSAVAAVDFSGASFELHFKDGRAPVLANNLCLGSGKPPQVPDCARAHLGDDCFHAINIARRDFSAEGRKVLVVGGGQSGAEVVQALLDSHWGRPASVCWLSRRANFEPLDEAPFTNEYFTPQYLDAFFDLPGATKRRIVDEQKLASDGISPDTLKALYQRLYEGHVRGDLPRVELMPGRTLTTLSRDGGFQVGYRNKLDGRHGQRQADLVILATGFGQQLPAYLAPIRDRLALDDQGQLQLERDFRVRWQGPDSNRIFAVNAGRYSLGIAEPQMSLMCWRSATIINALAGRTLFDTDQALSLIHWREPQTALAMAV
ncbi:SidA/IucD/PvdA family monooxygenase [Gallaecimonas sp. GXIMD4217]|uniref:lysine N(6)-hydroxylase/L-ornithine N(5)-oxygenase family protein n=1 Tax=Gallaecimonas sp. GXIMD4217 TaxID=3131927 RepID=UPI00311ACF8A